MTRQIAGVLIVAGALATPAFAQQQAMPEMTPQQKAEMEVYLKAGTPGEPHKALAATVGTYTLQIKSWQEPGGPATEETGTATRTMALDGRVLIEEVSATMMGMPFKGHSMTGFDNVTGKYWSTWTDSMSTGLMVSEGACDAERTCTFTGTWNDPIKKAPMTARMTSRRTGPGTEVFEMYGPGRDGKEMKMMEMTYTKPPADSYTSRSHQLTIEGVPVSIDGASVAPGFFDAAGVRPHLGRFFRDSDHLGSARPVVVLSGDVWAERFGSAPTIVGQSIELDGQRVTVVGVAPRSFRTPPQALLWTARTQ